MPQSNIYEAGAAEILALFEGHLEGSSLLSALAISSHALGHPARNAILKSLEAFGYGSTCCSFTTLAPAEPGGDGAKLDPQSLFLLVEALDPLMLIVADEESARILAQAYRTGFDTNAPTRIFGRPAVIFANLEALVQTDDGKQRVWKLMKSLPKRP